MGSGDGFRFEFRNPLEGKAAFLERRWVVVRFESLTNILTRGGIDIQ